MKSKILKSRAVIEILSIAGIMALFIYIDVRLGVLEWAIGELVRFAPEHKGMLITYVGGMWVGLITYSYYKKSQSQRAVRARKKIELELSNQKLVNNITGLPNREGFECLLNQSGIMRELPHWSVLAIELSNISSIRRIHGKDTGDLVENHIASMLKSLVNATEAIAHDEHSVFYFVVTSESEDETLFRIDQVVEILSKFIEPGIANGTGQDGEVLNIQLKYAAMKKDRLRDPVLRLEKGSIAKRLGFAFQYAKGHSNSGIEYYSDEMETALQRRVVIEKTMANAIKEKHIAPCFQPFVDLDTGRTTGFEILARWNHPKIGLLMPNEFIPVAEMQGKLGEMTLLLLEQACDALKGWPKHIKLSINVSPANLQDDVLASKIIDIVLSREIDPHRLEIEITETAFIKEADKVGAAIERLKDAGMTISIDDFGTGYSSLHHLRMLPFDKIKIDQSFVSSILTNSDSLAIVQNIIALGKSLGLPTTAEGVESGEAHALLKEFGCAIGQGYLYAKPLDIDEVVGFLNEFHFQSLPQHSQMIAAA